ncbi:hypothetical protein D3C86_1426640 [compost metagenome]
MKIKSGEATPDELEAFAAATSQLNERAIILRYKAYEAQVYGNPVSVKEVEVPPVPEAPAAIKEDIVPVIEAQEFHPEPQQESSFDLFGIDSEEEEEEETIGFELIEERIEEIPEEEPIVHTPEPVFEEEEKVPEFVEPPLAAPIENTQDLHPIYKKLTSNGGTLAERLMSVRLDTLKGAFGFNERLQIIQELFNGSNDEFNSLIEQLETITSKEEGRALVSNYANRYQWDVDSQLAIELVQKVERKYA